MNDTLSKLSIILVIIAFVVLGIMTVIAISSAASCTYISAENVTNVPPPDIPMWIVKHYGTELCGYYTPDGYFANIFEMDAYYRWKYPEIYDSRIYDIVFSNASCRQQSDVCKINMTFMNWYWNDPDAVREWLREKWHYPDDWRVIIQISIKIYHDNGETIKAFDRQVAITQELINDAKAEHLSASVSNPVVRPYSTVNMMLVAGILPSYYENVASNYTQIFEQMGFAQPAKSILDQIIDFLVFLKNIIVSII